MKKIGVIALFVVMVLLINFSFVSAIDGGGEDEGGFLNALKSFFSFKWMINLSPLVPPTSNCPQGCNDGNDCTADECVAGSCVHYQIPSCSIVPPTSNCPGDCDDDNDCTYDYCNPGVGCEHSPIPGCGENLCINAAIRCNDNNPCTTDGCDGETGDCGHSPIPGCGQNLCINAVIRCNDNNPCTIDGCDGETGNCEYTEIPDCQKNCLGINNFFGFLNPCNDNDKCTTDRCINGKCVNEEIPGCSNDLCVNAEIRCNDNDECTADSCDPNTGVCQNIDIPGCGYDFCSGILCYDGDECTRDSCDSKTGRCIFTQIPNCKKDPCENKDCGDDDECTTDGCDNGVCFNNPIPNCGKECLWIGNFLGFLSPCSDNDKCTEDSCRQGICVNKPIANCEPECESSDECVSGSACIPGSCVNGKCEYNYNGPDCNDGNSCTTDYCNSATGCVNRPLEGCTNGGCGIKKCVSDLECDDNAECTEDRCIDGFCTYDGDDGICDDGNVCNGKEYCQATGCNHGCAYSKEELNCEDGNACIESSCDSKLGCQYRRVNCNDGIECTKDGCNSYKGCENKPDDSLCQSGEKCSPYEGCKKEKCSSCENCDDFFSIINLRCNYQKCHSDCYAGEGCYFKGFNLFAEDCVPIGEACLKIKKCEDYSVDECISDVCKISKEGCEEKNKKCVEKKVVQCKPDCFGKQCGDDKCGGSCGGCGDNVCELGTCVPRDTGFPAGTRVLMADGSYKNIEDIKVGDKVLSNSESNERVSGEVLETREKMSESSCEVIFSEGKLATTKKTYINTKEGWKIVEIKTETITKIGKFEILEKGDEVLLDEGYKEVEDVICSEGSGKIYHLKIDVFNYFVEVASAVNVWQFGNAPCVPIDCTGLECGDNGCGGSCGSCPSDKTCSAGKCVELGADCRWASGRICVYQEEYKELFPKDIYCYNCIFGDIDPRSCSFSAGYRGSGRKPKPFVDFSCYYQLQPGQIYNPFLIQGSAISGSVVEDYENKDNSDEDNGSRSIENSNQANTNYENNKIKKGNSITGFVLEEGSLDGGGSDTGGGLESSGDSGNSGTASNSNSNTGSNSGSSSSGSGTIQEIELSQDAKQFLKTFSVGHNVILESGKPINPGEWFVTKVDGNEEQYWKFIGIDADGSIVISPSTTGDVMITRYSGGVLTLKNKKVGITNNGGSLIVDWGGKLIDKDEELGLKSGIICNLFGGKSCFYTYNVCSPTISPKILFKNDKLNACEFNSDCRGPCNTLNPQTGKWEFTGCCLKDEKYDETLGKCVPNKPCNPCEVEKWIINPTTKIQEKKCVPKYDGNSCLRCDPATELVEYNPQKCPTATECYKMRTCRVFDQCYGGMSWWYKCPDENIDRVNLCCRLYKWETTKVPQSTTDPWHSTDIDWSQICNRKIITENTAQQGNQEDPNDVNTGTGTYPTWRGAFGPNEIGAFYLNSGCDGEGDPIGSGGPLLKKIKGCMNNKRAEHTYGSCRWDTFSYSSYDLIKTEVVEDCGQCSACEETTHEEVIELKPGEYLPYTGRKNSGCTTLKYNIAVVDSTQCVPKAKGDYCDGPYKGRNYASGGDGGGFGDIIYSCDGKGICEMNLDSSFMNNIGITPEEPPACIAGDVKCAEECDLRLSGESSACESGCSMPESEKNICHALECNVI